MEKADKEKFMSEIWKKYNATKNYSSYFGHSKIVYR